METMTEDILMGYTNAGALKGGKGEGFDFNLISEGLDGALGSVRVNMWINPTTCMRKLYINLFVNRIQ